jgi:hypothetical protein
MGLPLCPRGEKAFLAPKEYRSRVSTWLCCTSGVTQEKLSDEIGVRFAYVLSPARSPSRAKACFILSVTVDCSGSRGVLAGSSRDRNLSSVLFTIDALRMVR